jgi:hypothetical protein
MNEQSETQTVNILKALHKDLRIEAAKQDITIGEAANEAVEAWIKSKRSRSKKDLQPA